MLNNALTTDILADDEVLGAAAADELVSYIPKAGIEVGSYTSKPKSASAKKTGKKSSKSAVVAISVGARQLLHGSSDEETKDTSGQAHSVHSHTHTCIHNTSYNGHLCETECLA
jgi:hypothetical protein